MKYFTPALTLFLSLICGTTFAQQISVDNTISPQDLVQNTLIQGCVEVSNISSPSNGSVNGLGSLGYFEKGSSNFPFQNGIVLTTGNANSAGNGQNNSILNDGDASWGSDSDLETALGVSGTLNATSLQFDFISISNQLQFNYIFASEEYYGNFPCDYSDGFAFLIREAGSSEPFTNIALIPGTSTPVDTNTIHDEIIGFCEANNAQYFEGYNIGDTNYNGRTTVLSAIATIEPNVRYEIKLVIADQTDENYDSAVFIEGNSFSSSVDLGEDFSTCSSNALLNGNIDNPDATYTWFFNNAPISSANQVNLNAIQSGNYRVEIEIPFLNGSCTIEDEINIVLNSTQSSDPISDYNVCDDLSNDGVETFDLSTKDAEVLASVPPSDYTFSYHYNYAEAYNNNNPITSPIQNITNPQTIHVRIEDTNSGCLAFSTVQLNVNQLPTIVDPTPLELCDDQTADGFTTMDLNELKDDEITNGQTDLIVTYHNTASDADFATNAIPMPYVNTSTTEQLFVSVMNPETGCNSTTVLDLFIIENPVINTEDHYIDACDFDHNGFAFFDLTSVIPEVIEGLTDVSISFYTTEEDALSASNPIADETDYQNLTDNVQIIFIRVERNSTGCASITPIELHTNLLLTATALEDARACDIDNDGVEDFDFVSIAERIINDLPDVTVEFYETESNRDNQTNPINQNVPYPNQSNPQTIYLTLNSLTCSEVAEIDLVLSPIRHFESIVSIDTCDDDQDGFTTIDLSTFNEDVTEGEEGYSVTYFLTEDEAINNTNALPNFYTNVTNPFTLYPRIRFDETGCSSVNSFEVTVLPAPLSEKPEDIIICDADRDGFYTLNLSSSIPNSILGTADRSVSFHNSQDDADSDTNAISNVNSYNAQTEIVYMRVENSVTGCHTTEELSIIVNTLPYVGDLSNYVNEYTFCEDESDGIGEFIFENKDAEVLDGQTGKEVSYYQNLVDAENKTNPIEKSSIYENISNPQEIFVRVDNITDESCYTTSSFMIEVGTNPVFNEPKDILVCDDVSNDGSEVFDLTAKIAEISAGIPSIENITFYTTESDAINSTNSIPLQFANTVNPQQIYVQIDNGTICKAITSFVVNVISVPDMSPVAPMVECDDDTDGSLIFDLTLAEENILDVRQKNIVIAYFRNFNDLDSDSNPIPNPESFSNTTNPQTVYIKVTNTISNCYASYPIELIVNQSPPINDFVTYNTCSSENGTVDLTEINTVVTENNYNIVYSYFSNEADAIANTNPLETNYSYITNNDELFVRVQYTTTHCFDYYKFNLSVNPLPVANQPGDLISCDDNFDGLFEFDLSQQNSSILGNQNSNTYNITYYNNLDNAHNNLAALQTNYMAFDSEIIYARIENNTTGCYSITQFSTYIIPLPEVDIPDQVICLDNLPLLVSANTNNSTDQYVWSTGATSPEVELTEIGTYWVTVTSEYGCEITSVFNVSESESATIEVTEVIDFSDPNNITVTISGIGNYLYQLDNDEPQESNVFENVAMGYHTVTIIDLNGCANVTKEVLVIDIPKFFTPNDDGAFDTWHIVGVETLPGTTVDIFDRYGKYLAKLSSSSAGWNGYYKGNKLPASDYWFVAHVKRGTIEFEVKGHFTLRR
jgi:gliding motility-associated-like protein